MYISTISVNGGVVIPKDLRELYGLKKGDRILFLDCGGMIAIVPAPQTPVEQSIGMLKGKTSLVKELVKSRQQDTERGK
jgi:AbrB family looped-hinge helix DNA binding protein